MTDMKSDKPKGHYHLSLRFLSTLWRFFSAFQVIVLPRHYQSEDPLFTVNSHFKVIFE